MNTNSNISLSILLSIYLYLSITHHLWEQALKGSRVEYKAISLHTRLMVRPRCCGYGSTLLSWWCSFVVFHMHPVIVFSYVVKTFFYIIIIIFFFIPFFSCLLFLFYFFLFYFILLLVIFFLWCFCTYNFFFSLVYIYSFLLFAHEVF